MGRIRVFIACSLDGFIAGEGNDLSFLPHPEPGSDASADDAGYGAFMDEVGAVVLGRTTFDVVAAMELPEAPWGERPVFVLTHRALSTPWPTARAVAGDLAAVIEAARAAAGEKDVYVDGGVVVRAAIEAGVVDDAIVTIVPVLLGRGAPLFAGLSRRQPLELVSSRVVHSGMVQVRYRLPRQPPGS